MKIRNVLFLGLITILFASVSYGQNVVIINPNLQATEVSSSDLSNIYLGKSSTLNGNKVSPVDQKQSSAVAQAFRSNVLKIGESDYQNRWVEKMLSGEASPPPTKASDAEVIEFVKSTSGGLGYVSASSDLSGVTVLKVDGKEQW